ncbi:MAG TPA: isoprenylcysteine carboxylmethyltransferase family protein [Candidatus Saccharimonadia bacterium]|nr:isoprenylcysteine carboxylmethyltransferase family protein [Candidatus Saccharimonadia bacterium]
MSALSDLILWIWLVFWVYWLVSATRSKKNIRSTRFNKAWSFRFVIILMVVFFFPSFYKDYQVTNNELLIVIGFCLFLLGLALSMWARLHIGRNWGMPMTKKEHPQLVTSGPYKFIRHPIYSGLLLAFLGSGLAGNTFWLTFLAFSLIYFIYSAKIEEKNMTSEFGKTYLDYKDKTKMLIPFVL